MSVLNVACSNVESEKADMISKEALRKWVENSPRCKGVAIDLASAQACVETVFPHATPSNANLYPLHVSAQGVEVEIAYPLPKRIALAARNGDTSLDCFGERRIAELLHAQIKIVTASPLRNAVNKRLRGKSSKSSRSSYLDDILS